jgi:hypothetical protein
MRFNDLVWYKQPAKALVVYRLVDYRNVQRYHSNKCKLVQQTTGEEWGKARLGRGVYRSTTSLRSK